MFRKKSAAPQPPRHNPPTPSAITAAAQVFLKQQQNDATLSNAAAAAALRSHTTSPTPVGDIQTKRMVRRGSQSSYSGGTTAVRPPFGGLQRSGSSGSMSGRTFRSQSPGGSRSNSPVRPTNVPPVPIIPSNIQPIASNSQKRSSSLQPNHNRMSSPPPATPQTRPVVNTAQQSASAGGRPKLARPASAIGYPTSPTTDSPRSINFSRPMSPQMNGSPDPRGAPPTQAAPAGSAQRPASSLGFSSIQQQVRAAQRNAKLGNTRSTSTNLNAMTAALTAATATAQTSTPPKQKANSRPASAMASYRSQPPSNGPPGMVWVPMDEAIRRGLVPASGTPQTSRPASAQSSRPASAMASSRTRPPAAAPKVPQPAATPKAPQPAAPIANVNKTQAQRPPLSANGVPAPSDEQIRVFQTRAAALLARPRTDAAAAAGATKAATVAKAQPAEASSEAPSTTMTPPSKSHMRSASQPVSQLAPPVAKPARTPSMSPSRSAHFSQSPVLAGIKHEPPPRAASPFKSALKSPSPRPGSPVGSHGVPMSDTSSLRSDDGSTSGAKRKKQVRVSFDATPLSVGEAATPTSPINTVLSPQNNKNMSFPDSDEEPGMGARPALPTFGSVRSRKSSDKEQSSAESPVDSIPTPPLAASAPVIAVEPATPATEELKVLTAPEENRTYSHKRTTSLEDELSAENVDNVMQSSPKSKSGEWRSSAEYSPTTTRFVDHGIVDQTYVQPSGELDPSAHSQEPDAFVQEPIKDAAQDSDEEAETFADAAEEPADGTDAAGFASLDAILEDAPEEGTSQIAPPEDHDNAQKAEMPVVSEPGLALTTPGVSAAQAAKDKSDQDWETIRAYWSSLSSQQKLQLEAEALPLPGEEDPLVEGSPPTPSNLQARAARAKGQSVEEAMPPWPDKSYQNSTATKSVASGAFTSTSKARTAVPKVKTEPALARGSLRSGKDESSASRRERTPVNSMSNSLRGRGASPTKTTQGPSAEAIALAKAIAPKTVMKKPTLLRSNSSDSVGSDSSFKRSRRRANSNDGGHYSMKRSMRGADPKPTPMTKHVAAAPPPAKRSTMRTSVRGSIDSTNSNDTRPSKESSRFSFLPQGKAKAKKTVSKSTGFSSRFGDSSDEDDDVEIPASSNGFRSRFADSDDEDEDIPTRLAPVRKLPRRAGQEEGDSTDLSDDSDAESTRPANIAHHETDSNLANGKSFGKALGAGTLRSEGPSHERTKSKSSIFGLGRKKHADPVLSSPASAKTAPVSSGRPDSRMSSSLRPGSSTNRSSSKSSFLRRLSFSQPTTPSQTHTNESEFPFVAPPIPDIPEKFRQPASADRPFTADGVGPTRPPLGSKRDSTMTAPESGNEKQVIYSSRTGRKKKFQGLRRVLNLT